MITTRYKKFDVKLSLDVYRLNIWYFTTFLSACGANQQRESREIKIIGFASDYDAPVPSYEDPKLVDPYFKSLEPILVDPYWISALKMSDAESVINQMLTENDRLIEFSFPTASPDYIPVSILGWAPASQNMISASREIFTKLEEILNVRIEESQTPDGLNKFVIAQSIQVRSSGFSYFPNNDFKIGSDVFISKDYSNPSYLNDSQTNYDYEVLVHEIGHALGLKHPFEGDRNNFSILNAYEDQTKFTAMSYDDIISTFDGSFRSLDWMALTKFYGVNPEFRSNDDVYKFDDDTGIFIIDGSGLDSISMPDSTKNIVIDLRPGAHSFEGQKSIFITDAGQLTISHGSEIENVLTGFGHDTIIGNHLSNIIVSGSGDDKIFAGEGNDTVYSGIGQDTIDLSEDINVQDRIILLKENIGTQFDIVYGFVQGALGDIIDLTDLYLANLTKLPIVDISNVPVGYIDNCLVRVFGEGLSEPTRLSAFFESGGILENLSLSSDKRAVLITSNSQNTGEVQNIYAVENSLGSNEVYHLYQLVGNYLDIDSWSMENFINSADSV